MVHIITDTSALFTVAEGNDMDVHVIPLCVSIQDEHYRDLCFDTSSFLEKVRSGGIPTSQPPIGDVLAAYEEQGDEEILNICMADGLSGTYQTASMAKEQAMHADNITVLNSQTLCGPHRYLVEKAVKLRDEGKTAAEIVAALKDSMSHEHSFLIPQDFSFLKRGGRLKPAAASIGGLLKLKSVMHAVENGSRLDKFTITRTLSKAADAIIEYFREHGVDAAYRIYVAHADALADARFFIDRLKQAFPDTELELLKLSPAFITQGGPQCVAIQYIRK
ncbi:MAG: DegV family protein [Clostridium sp.]